jgi:hypothetical protein
MLPADDLYGRLEVPVGASFEAIEIAWRSLLRRHHPDVAGSAGLELAKRINVAHDWLSDPDLRRRYDTERHPTLRNGRLATDGAATRAGHRAARAGAAGARMATTHRPPVDPAAALERFLDRVARLTADELDRLDCADPAPIAFLATIRRFLPDDRLAATEVVEARIRERLAPTSWARPAVREAVLGYATELVLEDFLDELLTEPFRGRVRERLSRGWEAAVGQPRHGPNGAAVAAFIRRLDSLDAAEARALAATGTAERLGDDPWPRGTSIEDDEALRVSSVMAARDAAAVVPPSGLERAALVRARRAAGRIAHLLVLRHAFPPSEYERLVAPWRTLLVPIGRRSGSARG